MSTSTGGINLQRLGAPDVYPNNPGEYRFLHVHAESYLDVLNRFPKVAALHLPLRGPNGSRLRLLTQMAPTYALGLQWVGVGVPGSWPRRSPRWEPGLGGGPGAALAHIAFERDGTAELTAEKRFADWLSAHGFGIRSAEPGSSVMGGSVRLDGHKWNLVLRGSSDGNVVGASSCYLLGRDTTVGAEGYWSFTNTDKSWSFGGRHVFSGWGLLPATVRRSAAERAAAAASATAAAVFGGVPNPNLAPIISASLNAYGRSVVSLSLPVSQNLQAVSRLLYDLGTSASRVRLGAEWRTLWGASGHASQIILHGDPDEGVGVSLSHCLPVGWLAAVAWTSGTGGASETGQRDQMFSVSLSTD